MRRLVLPEKKGYSGEVGLGLRGEGGRRHPYIDACRRRGGLDLLWGGGGGAPVLHFPPSCSSRLLFFFSFCLGFTLFLRLNRRFFLGGFCDVCFLGFSVRLSLAVSFSLFSFFFLAGIGASVTWNFGVGWWSEVLGVIR